MTKDPQPDRTAEAARVRDDLSHEPSALRALDALAREENSETAIPPIPDELREQWKDRYGEARRAQTSPTPSLFSRFSKWWVTGGAVAFAAFVILITLRSDPAAPGPSGSDDGTNRDLLMRGGSDFEPREDTITVYLASETISFQDLYETRETDFTLEANDLADAVRLLEDQDIAHAVILDGRTGILTPWDGQLLEDVPLLEINDSTDQYDLSEALDDYLKP